MYLADCHLHSTMSHDGSNTYEEMALAAIEKEFDMICFTEHADDCCTGLSAHDRSYPADRPVINENFDRAKAKYGTRVRMCHGIELSSIPHTPEKAQLISSFPELDFIIGSLHNLRDEKDFLHIEYTSPQQCRELAQRYMEEEINAVSYGCCDVLGHLGYMHRYMVNQNQGVDMMEFGDMFRVLFKKAVEAGIGIEVNTSGLRGKANTVFPLPQLIKMYRELGGEIITIGSDSHCCRDLGAGIREAQMILQTAGFRYYTVFEKRKADFIQL